MSGDRRTPCPECGELILWARTWLDGPDEVPVHVTPEADPRQARTVVRSLAGGGLLVRARHSFEPVNPSESPAVGHSAVCRGQQLAKVIPFPTRRAS